ncbi:MAG: choice-of-anchor I family protein [Chitinophagaceae bacterium]|nr:choice-of-anchor I family protein [Chitinophagaceae bacterium]
MKRKITYAIISLTLLSACSHDEVDLHEQAASFTEISTTDLGESGAAEISAYDPQTKKLFVVTNAGIATRIDVLDFDNPAIPVVTGFIDIAPYGGGVNSVSVFEGKLAAAVEGFVKTDPGKIVIFKTTDHSVIRQVAVGALPDMVTFSYDGKFILSANEGEPSTDYLNDPLGTVSIVSVKDNYSVTTLDFSAFSSQAAQLKAKGLRLFGPNASFGQDMEPEYLTVSPDSRTAWVTLQENNAIAKIDIRSRTITNIFPLGFKDYNIPGNSIDPSDRDNAIALNNWPVKGMFQPDAIAVMDHWGKPFVFTANEGDVREYVAFTENKRIKDLVLDPVAFPNAATLKADANLGRLNVTITLGDDGNDGDFDKLFSFGARSFSVWNGNNGQLLFDSGNELEKKAIDASKYDDGRSDDKGVEPEGITLGYVGKRTIAFVGMERADLVALYDVSDPSRPTFIKALNTGDGPEGLLFIPAKLSPTGKSLLVVSSENDGTIKVYQTN